MCHRNCGSLKERWRYPSTPLAGIALIHQLFQDTLCQHQTQLHVSLFALIHIIIMLWCKITIILLLQQSPLSSAHTCTHCAWRLIIYHAHSIIQRITRVMKCWNMKNDEKCLKYSQFHTLHTLILMQAQRQWRYGQRLGWEGWSFNMRVCRAGLRVA